MKCSAGWRDRMLANPDAFVSILYVVHSYVDSGLGYVTCLGQCDSILKQAEPCKVSVHWGLSYVAIESLSATM